MLVSLAGAAPLEQARAGFVGRLLDERGQPTRLSTEEARLLASLQQLDPEILKRGLAAAGAWVWHGAADDASSGQQGNGSRSTMRIAQVAMASIWKVSPTGSCLVPTVACRPSRMMRAGTPGTIRTSTCSRSSNSEPRHLWATTRRAT